MLTTNTTFKDICQRFIEKICMFMYMENHDKHPL